MQRNLLAALPFAVLAGCSAWEYVPSATPGAIDAFEVPDRSASYSEPEAFAAFRAEAVTDYRLWDGDQIQIDVLGRPELSGPHTIGPDGKITLPVAGVLLLRNQTRQEAAASAVKALSHFYKDVSVATVRVDRYASNRVIVLGRVEHPGALPFESPPLLLEILAKAGGFPLMRPEQVLTRCAVIRGDRILWIDVKRLLSGDISLNIQLARNDVVYIPDATDTSVYVLGAVNKPGVFRLTPQMSFLDVLSQSGGPTPDADMTTLHLIRPSKNVHLEIDMADLLEPNPKLIVSMEQGDIVYVARSGVAKVGYILQKVNPFATLITLRNLATF
ncbi:MAG: SLBB domain-containing protein [Candidatus Methylumidiphilus sp.]